MMKNIIDVHWTKCCFTCKHRGYTSDLRNMACEKHEIRIEKEFICKDYERLDTFPREIKCVMIPCKVYKKKVKKQ